MNRKFRPSSIIDCLGVVALTIAAAALAGILFAAPIVQESTLFSIFHWSLALGLSGMIANRVAEIARVIATTPDPKAMRCAPRADTATLAVAEHSNVTDGKFRKAA